MIQLETGPLIADLDGIELDSVDKDVLRHPKLGGLILFSRNFESRQQLQDLVRCIREIRPELAVCVDQEGGRVQRFRSGFTRLPAVGKIIEIAEQTQYEAQAAFGNSTETLAAHLGYLMASELVELDIDHSFAPVLDLDRHSSRVIGDRAFSDDAEQTVALAGAFMAGMREAGMVSTAKHFPGHGGVVEDSHLELPHDGRSYEMIRARDLIPFQKLSECYAAVMTAHIVFDSVDSQAVSFSRKWLKSILREELNFQGLVLSDDLSMQGAVACGDVKSRSRMALEAGCDLILLCNQRQEAERVLEYLEAEQLGASGAALGLKRRPSALVSSWAETMRALKNQIAPYC